MCFCMCLVVLCIFTGDIGYYGSFSFTVDNLGLFCPVCHRFLRLFELFSSIGGSCISCRLRGCIPL